MIQTVSGMFDAPWWPLAEAVLLVWGLFGLIALIMARGLPLRRLLFAWAGVAMLGASIVASMLFEDLLPQWSRMPPSHRLPYAGGLAIILAGTIALVIGGAVWSRRKMAALSRAAGNEGGRSAGRWLWLMALGGLLIVLGARLINP